MRTKVKRITSYVHPPAEPSTQEPDNQPGPYYVSIRDGERVGFLLGPFDTHAEALALVDTARQKANEVSPRDAAFAGFGTCRRKDGHCKPGVLNELCGVTPTFSAN